MSNPGISIAGTAVIGAPEPVWVARSKNHLIELSTLYADPAERHRIAVYVGGQAHTWYLPSGAAYKFFDDDKAAVVIYPRGGLDAGKQAAFAVGVDFFNGFDDYCGMRSMVFKMYQNDFDPERERRAGRELPVHFHWMYMPEDLVVPAAVHCSTEPYHATTTIVVITQYLADPQWDTLESPSAEQKRLRKKQWQL
jgi:hypothetical protein